MNSSQMLKTGSQRLRLALIVLVALTFQLGICAQQINARYLEGTVRGFLSVADSDGKVLAAGDITQIVRGDRVTIHVVFHYKDGSIDDEKTVFTQRGTLKLISDDHVQKGPFFPTPVNLSIDVTHQLVTVRTTDKEGKEQDDTKHMNLPPDLYNGMLSSVVRNLKADATVSRVSMLIMAPKPRLIKLAISPGDEVTFSMSGTERKARVYTVKIELGGIAGVVAPMVGKAPPDIHVWLVSGDVPLVIREDAPMFDGSPILSFLMASPVWSHKTD